MATTAKDIFSAVRKLVSAVPNITRVNSNRNNDAPATGKFTASVLYRGDDMTLQVVNCNNDRVDHALPVAIQVRTTSKNDDDLIDKLYAVFDAVKNKSLWPDDISSEIINITPVNIDEPEGTEYISANINIIVNYRGA